MAFDSETIEMLEQPLNRDVVATRKQGNFTLSYVEGWHVIAEANRIFGFDGWHRETVDLRCVSETARKIGQQGADGWGVTYIAKSEIAIDGVVRHGYGSGHGIDRDLGLAHESAVKEAETDAMKRALMTFGWTFGLALYDKKQEHVSKPGSNVRGAVAPKQEMQGTQKITELKSNIKAFAEELEEVDTSKGLEDLLTTFHDTLKNAEMDLPSWYSTGDGMPEEFEPLKDRINNKRERLAIQGI